MSKTVKKIMILAGVFLAAVGIYFITSFHSMEQSQMVYTAMEEPALPVVYTDLYGREKNRLAGYRQEMGNTTARESLTVLPEDRQLKVYISEYGIRPLKISYEIRSLDLSRLVERTQIDAWETEGETGRVSLPIQNLLTRGEEYLLHIILETEQFDELHYYTRILWPEADYGQAMLELARDFSGRTLTGERANELVTYLETTATADNSSLGHVTIKSSFSQLMWAGLDMELAGEMQVTLRELKGIMGQVQVSYQVTRNSENGEKELYEVEDYYTMKQGTKRIYLMDFNRTANQVFSGERDLYSGKRILLGIGNDETVQLEKSPSRRYLAFVFNRELWCYDQAEKKATKIFTFRSNADTSGRSGYGHHNIRVLSVKDSGEVEFLIYGYMNRGLHEGYQGISLCGYSNGTIQERFFAPTQKSFDELGREIEKLCYCNGRGLLYLYEEHGVFGIDLSSREYIVVADGLREGCYAISPDKTRLAWQEEEEAHGSGVIHVFDMSTGMKQEIKAGDGTGLRVLGFVQSDFVYGLTRPEDTWVMNGRQAEVPMYGLEIVDRNLNVQTRYENPGYYVANVVTEDTRVHMDRLVKTGDLQYVYHDSDTIVCNETSAEDYMEGIGWFASEIRRKLYFIQLDQELNSGSTVKVTVSKEITYDQSEELALNSDVLLSDTVFYAYGRGSLAGIYPEFSEAVEAVYEMMGVVTDENQRILWARANRSNARTLRDPQRAVMDLMICAGELERTAYTGGGLMALDARGCILNQVLYFVDQGIPVIAYGENGSQLLIYAFDQYNITVLNLMTGENYKMGLNDSAEYFGRYGNDFICGIMLSQ